MDVLQHVLANVMEFVETAAQIIAEVVVRVSVMVLLKEAK